jgi:GTP-binding protein
VDGADPDPEWDHDVIREELRAHDPALLEKPMVVVFNKIDLPAAAKRWPEFRDARARDTIPCVALSADRGTGLDDLRTILADLLPDAADMAAPPEPSGVVVHRLETLDDTYSVTRESPGVYRVRGRRIERIAVQTDFEVDESAHRFQRALDRLGIDGALRREGIAAGDVVRIGSTELVWEGDAWGEDA